MPRLQDLNATIARFSLQKQRIRYPVITIPYERRDAMFKRIFYTLSRDGSIFQGNMLTPYVPHFEKTKTDFAVSSRVK
jgi:hypothetical protein